VPADATYETWADIGRTLCKINQSVQWWYGDWWIHAETRYGQRRYQFETIGLPVDYHTCENYATVARRFETSRRREGLAFGHHEAVAALSPEEADRLLDWAEATITTEGRPRSIRELREKVRQLRTITVEVTTTPIPPMPSGIISLTSYRVEQLPPPPARLISVSPMPVPNTVVLDQSSAGPVPPELAGLREAPAQEPDRVAMARAALNALTAEQGLDLVREWATVRGEVPMSAAIELLRELEAPEDDDGDEPGRVATFEEVAKAFKFTVSGGRGLGPVLTEIVDDWLRRNSTA
jgi:hypothetical protein